MKLQGKIVDGLNQVLTAHRLGANPEKLLEQVASLARPLSQQILEWLHGEPVARDIFIVGHLEGGKLTCQFILYHCKRIGNVNVWEEEDKWKATVKNKRDEAIGAISGLAPAETGLSEKLVPELTRLLTQFIEQI